MGRFGTTVKAFPQTFAGANSAHKACSNGLENFALSAVVCALMVAGSSFHAALPAEAKKAAKSKESTPAAESPGTTSSTSAPAPVKESAYPAVDRMEKFLFFRVYYDEDAESRLKRLDQNVFGEANEGSIEDRMAKLDAVLAPKMKAKEEENERAKAEADAAKVAAATPAKPETPAGASEAELAAERARIAAQAAREQEIKNVLSEAANLWRAKKGPEALERFEQVLRLDPQNSEAQFSMGVIEESRGKLNQALTRYEQAAKIDPDNPDFSEAVSAIQKKIKSGGIPAGPQGDAKRLRDAATLAFKRGEYFSALDLYKQLDEKVPNQALTKYNIGSIYLMLKDHYNALDYYQQAHKLEGADERFTKAYNDLAAEMKKTRGALEENKKTAEAEWNPPSAMANQPKSSSSKKPKDTPKVSKNQPPQQPRQNSQPSGAGQQVAANPGYQQPPYQQQPPQQQYQRPAPQQYQQPPQQQYQQPYQQQYQQPPPQQQYQQPPPQQQYQQPPPQQQYQQPYQQQYQQPPPQQQYQQPPPQQQYQQPPPQQQYQQPPPQQQYQQQYQQPQQFPVQPVFSTAPVQQYQQPPQSGGLSSYGIRGKGTSDGVMVTGVSGGSRAARAGLTNGDIIRTVDGNEVTQPSQLEQALSTAPGSLQMLVFRNGSLVVLNF